MRIAEALRRLALCRATLAGALALVVLGAQAGSEPSAAEEAIFMRAHLTGLAPPAVLHYAYREQGGGGPVVEDSADLALEADGPDAYRVSARFLSDERQVRLPVVSGATANPVVLYFLEHDVRRMHADLGGATNYFRRHIRLALAEAAEVAPVHFELDGRRLEGTRIRIEPFRDVDRPERLQGRAGKRYEFILSAAVPGGVYDVRTRVPDAAGQAGREISLTLNGGGS